MRVPRGLADARQNPNGVAQQMMHGDDQNDYTLEIQVRRRKALHKKRCIDPNWDAL
jgi:hypothetical protein